MSVITAFLGTKNVPKPDIGGAITSTNSATIWPADGATKHTALTVTKFSPNFASYFISNESAISTAKCPTI